MFKILSSGPLGATVVNLLAPLATWKYLSPVVTLASQQRDLCSENVSASSAEHRRLRSELKVSFVEESSRCDIGNTFVGDLEMFEQCFVTSWLDSVLNT